jgi:hypothetical protein
VNEFLAIYLRDHHAAGRAGTAHARRTAAHLDLPPARREAMQAVAAEIAEDLRSLESIMERLGTSPSPVKDTLAEAAERLGRLKGNGTILARSPLSNVVELEALVVGITGKLAMWTALREVCAHEPELDADELARLSERALRQREVVDDCRLEAARLAFEARAEASAR